MKKFLFLIVLAIFCNFSILKSNSNQEEDDEYAEIDKPLIYPTLNLSGPRVGVTYLQSGEALNKMEESFNKNISPVFSQFGWQFEYQYFKLPSGMAGMLEVIALIGGLEQDVIIPSASFLVGLRSAKGFEFGFGPNITPLGASFVIAAGFNLTMNDVNFPVNLALVPSSNGMRVSFMFGFNARKKKNSVHYN